jgi:hypothetical protein
VPDVMFTYMTGESHYDYQRDEFSFDKRSLLGTKYGFETVDTYDNVHKNFYPNARGLRWLCANIAPAFIRNSNAR